MDVSSSGRIGLGLLCKAPRAGTSKTRIGAVLGHETAAALAAAFLRDTMLTVSRVAEAGLVSPVVFYRPAGAEVEIARCVGTDASLMEQAGDELGAIMEHSLTSLLSLHPTGAIVLGSDVPTLPAEVIASVVGHLLRPGKRVVFGPATDGGFYLVASNTMDIGDLFAPMTWGTDTVLQTMRRRATAEGLEIQEVATWADVDTVEDLDRLASELERAAPENALHTRAVLLSLL